MTWFVGDQGFSLKPFRGVDWIFNSFIERSLVKGGFDVKSFR